MKEEIKQLMEEMYIKGSMNTINALINSFKTVDTSLTPKQVIELIEVFKSFMEGSHEN